MPRIYHPSGRACVRQTSEGFITMGVMHFNDRFQPEEFASYPLAFARDGISVSTGMLEAPGVHYEDSLSAWVTQPRWRSSNPAMHPELQVNSVRFVKAFENGYTFLSVSREDPLAKYVKSHAKNCSHYFVEFDQGHVKPFETPLTGHNGNGLNGQALSSILRTHCIWPDANGINHTLPDLSTVARAKFDQLRDIDRQLIIQSISKEDAAAQRQKLGEMATAEVLKDPQWRAFLKTHLEYNMVGKSDAPMKHAEVESKGAFSTVVARAIHEDNLDSPEVHAKLQEISGNPRIPLEPIAALTEPKRELGSSPELA